MLCQGSSISTEHETPQQGNNVEVATIANLFWVLGSDSEPVPIPHQQMDRTSETDVKIANRKRTRTEPTALDVAGWTVDGPFIALEECIEALKWLQGCSTCHTWRTRLPKLKNPLIVKAFLTAGHGEKSILESRQHLRELLMSNLSKHKYAFNFNSESTKQSVM